MVDERYEFTSGPDASPVAREYTFEMRPWTAEELHDRLMQAGYHGIAITSGVGRQTKDRFLVRARR